MKIALITDKPVQEIGGVQSYCYHLIREVNSRDKNIEFDPINISNIKYSFIKKLNLYYFSKKELKKRIEQCDIVHVNILASYPSMQAIDIAVRLRKKIICTSHYHPSYALNRPFLGELFYKLIVNKRLKFIDYLVTINKEEFSLFNEKVKKCSIIPHWINSDILSLIEKPIISQHDRAILFVGKVNQKHKRADFLFEVPSDIEVRYVSNVKMDAECYNFRQYKNLSNEELINLYRKTFCLIVPSKYEAFSFVSLEALLCGTRILVSDRVRIADFLEGNRLVTVFKYGDKSDFKEKLIRLFEEEISDDIVISSIDKVKSTFSPNRIIEEYISIYNSILKE